MTKCKLKIYNTLTRSIENFNPIHPNEVRMYSCGPTVYNYAHIGNFRSYIFSDILRRTLKLFNYKITHVMNITDVDDKTIANSNKQKIPLSEYTKKFTDEFFHDLKTLNIETVEHYPRATAHIDDMINLIQKLEKNGLTYKSENSIYFKINAFKNYGQLSKVDLSQNIDGYRVNSDEYDKDNVKDFVLWKGKKEGEPFWSTPYGDGRPGWHIECSAMSMKYLGETLDIHTGGNDLIFPHHENEIAQSEGATGKTFVNYWMHCAHLIVNGEKMSKSQGNFFTLRDLLEKGFSPKAIRFVLLTTHYRKKLNFTFDALKQAELSVQKIQNFYNAVRQAIIIESDNTNLSSLLTSYEENFKCALGDDLNISKTMAVVFDFMKNVNKLFPNFSLSTQNKEKIINIMNLFDSVLGILSEPETLELESDLQDLINQREEARKNKNWQLADEIRNTLKERRILIEDTPNGTKWKKI